MKRQAYMKWIAISGVLALAVIAAVAVYRYRWELKWNREVLESTSLWDLRIGDFPPTIVWRFIAAKTFDWWPESTSHTRNQKLRFSCCMGTLRLEAIWRSIESWAVG